MVRCRSCGHGWTESRAVEVIDVTPHYEAAEVCDPDHDVARLVEAARAGRELGLEVHAGHGLTYGNVRDVAAIPEVEELNIGHFLVGEAVFVGLAESVREMRRLMDAARAFSDVRESQNAL